MDTLFRSVDMEITADVEKRTIVGRAVTFGQVSGLLKDKTTGVKYKEVIAPGAFKRSLELRPDVVSFKEHDPKMILGRVSAGTLKVEERDNGLYVSIDVPNTTYGNDLLESVKRGDIKGFSFGFNPIRSKAVIRNGEKVIERSEVVLLEVSPTAMPAYSGTELNLRSEGDVWEDATASNALNAHRQRHAFTEFINSNL